MSSQLLTIEVSRLDAGHVRLRLTGDLDYDSAPDLIAAVAELGGDDHQQQQQQQQQRQMIDLTGVSLCDSSGLSALLVVHRAAGPSG
ncbi:STAS domain-containing protein [Micromonospora sp. U21]|uniref:STAS domain-containing protein n=1 Tax=Micromonospora sp. U21 TaxID=2824899 RepID=UPI001FFC8C7A|nr:STAS domain-containing protein [Micromonospora sp. U21]